MIRMMPPQPHVSWSAPSLSYPDGVAAERRRALDAYVELAKPRIVLMVLMTAAAGFLVGSPGGLELLALLVWLVGIASAAAGAGALNMLLERAPDALMARTRTRPLPEGRVEPRRALAFGAAAAASGVAVLSVLSSPAAGIATAVCLTLYLFVYTPLKRVSAWCIVPGAIAGAMPPLIGCTAAAGAIHRRALALFAIQFLWQLPHVVALGWLYREDYARAGLRMLPAGARAGLKTSLVAAGAALLLMPVSILPMRAGLAGPVYGCGAAVLGAAYASAALRFGVRPGRGSAKGLFLASIAYLPSLLLFLAAGRF